MGAPAVEPRNILVVDDQPLVCDAVRMLLAYDGHTVETAHSAKEALGMFAKGKYAVVFTDYYMPPFDGDKLALELKALDPQQPVIMITAHAEQLHNRPPEGVDCLVSKPFQLEHLRGALTKVLDPGKKKS
jgi:CheY-like chemotaxis protein